MASRAHPIPDFFVHAAERPRRAVRYPGRDEPVALPRDKSAGTPFVLMLSALVATSAISAAAYAVYRSAPTPPLSETPVAPLAPTWEQDNETTKAKVFELINGPARAVPNIVTASGAAEETDTSSTTSVPDQFFIDDSAQGAQLKPRPAPLTPASAAPERPATYPDPTSTPPDAIAPPGVSPDLPTPALDTENPYK